MCHNNESQYTECCIAGHHYAECHTECHYAEGQMLSVVVLSVIVPIVSIQGA